jgi:hypothetical protein
MSTLCLLSGQSFGPFDEQPTRGCSIVGGLHISGLTASYDTAIVRTTTPDSQSSYADEEPMGPVNGPHFAVQIDHGKLP